jgi:hypothetical protein
MISSGRSKSWNLFFPSTKGILNSSGFHLTAILGGGLGIGFGIGFELDIGLADGASLAESVGLGFP